MTDYALDLEFEELPPTPEQIREKAFKWVKVQTLLKGSVFITTIGFNLKFSWTTRIPTAATDGANLWFNPDFFDSLDKEERVFVYLHEIWHCAFMHMIRRGSRDAEKWNIAGDHCINLMLLDQGYKMPADGLADSKYRGKSTNEIYDLLPDNPLDKFIMDLVDPGAAGEAGEGEKTIDVDSLSAAAKATLEELVLRATQASKMQKDTPGCIPGEIAVNLQELINPVLPWNNLLFRFLDDFYMSDFSWRKPNRRLLHTAYLPSLWGESITNLTVAVDTSCSVLDEQFTAFVSEMNYIRECFPIELMTVVSFDTEIKNINRIKEGDDIRDVKFKGRGGTDLEWMPDYLIKNPSKVMIIFSDLEVSIPAKQPDVPVLWICIDNPTRTVPWGTLIHYTTK